jgi:small subunit ribosomal protein S9
MSDIPQFHAVGRRKASVARVWITPGQENASIKINGRDVEDYFDRNTHALIAMAPLELTGLGEGLQIKINVHGGGNTGQAGAIRHGLTRALIELEPETRGALKKAGFVTRDARRVERKKYGQPGARRRFQFSKR